MTIHTPDTRALVDEFGLDLQPATSTSIGLEEVIHNFYLEVLKFISTGVLRED